MAGTISIDGLASGLNTTELVDKLMAIERRSVILLEAGQARVNNQLAAFRVLNTKLLAFQTTANTVSRSAAFSAMTTSVSDETLLTATATSDASAGTYAVTVRALARAHQIASQGFADTDSTTIGTGEVQIQVGDAETVAVTVDSTANTLADLRDAINAAAAGVSAAIVNDGSDAVPYRLVLTADESGADNTIAITYTLTGGAAPVFDANAVSDVVADDGNTYAGTATSSGTYTGTANASYVVEIVDGGTLATATYRVSADGGTTWGSTLALAAGTIDVYDDVHGSDLGVDATFADDTFAAGDQFTIDAFVPTVQQAADAEVGIGSGTGQIVVKSSSNTVTNALPGVTLTLGKADLDDTVNITVAHDTTAVKTNINAFVTKYNEAMTFIREQTRYNAETETAGILLGNTSVLQIQRDLREIVLGNVTGLSSDMNRLSALGISVSATGTMTVDSSDLDDALDDDLDAVARLFQASGESTHTKVNFVAATDDTVAKPAGYTVAITQAATRGTLTGTSIADPAIGGLTIDDTNDKLVLAINGAATSTLTLTHKTYNSGTELANEIAAKIAASDSAVADTAVTFVDEGATGHLVVRTTGYGSGSTVALGINPSNSASTVLGLAAATATEGQDVAGTVDGVAAEGSGRILKVTNATSDAEGLWLEVTLTDDEVGSGVDAIVSVIKGIGKQATDLLTYLTDPVDGYMKSKENRFTTQVESYTDQIERKEALIEKRRARLVAQFVRLETTLQTLQSQSSFLENNLMSIQDMKSDD